MIVVLILLVFAGHICPMGPCFFLATWPFMHQDIKTAMENGGHSARLALRRNWQRAILVGLDRQH